MVNYCSQWGIRYELAKDSVPLWAPLEYERIERERYTNPTSIDKILLTWNYFTFSAGLNLNPSTNHFPLLDQCFWSRIIIQQCMCFLYLLKCMFRSNTVCMCVGWVYGCWVASRVLSSTFKEPFRLLIVSQPQVFFDYFDVEYLNNTINSNYWKQIVKFY